MVYYARKEGNTPPSLPLRKELTHMKFTFTDKKVNIRTCAGKASAHGVSRRLTIAVTAIARGRFQIGFCQRLQYGRMRTLGIIIAE